ncbi:hypothetical protein Dimus_011298 [Dionaea muscipula]
MQQRYSWAGCGSMQGEEEVFGYMVPFDLADVEVYDGINFGYGFTCKVYVLCKSALVVSNVTVDTVKLRLKINRREKWNEMRRGTLEVELTRVRVPPNPAHGPPYYVIIINVLSIA